MSKIPLQESSEDIWGKKYALRDLNDKQIEMHPEESFHRVAVATAAVEKLANRKKWQKKFEDVLTRAVPAGRILSNAGAEAYKPAVSLINCLAGDTEVLTLEYGVTPIKKLVDKVVHVVNGAGKWSRVTFSSHGIQTTYPMEFARLNSSRNSVSLRATAGHRWILEDGRAVTTEFYLMDIPRGFNRFPNVRAPQPKVKDKEQYSQGLLHGLVYGDGTKRVSEGDDVYQLDLISEKMELSKKVTPILGFEPNETTYGGNLGLRYTSIQSEIELKKVPTKELSLDLDYIRGFFAGILATDGSVDRNGNTACDILIYGDLALIQYLDKYLPTIGVQPTKIILFAKKGETTNFGKRRRDVYCIHVHPGSVSPSYVLRSFHKSKYVTGSELNEGLLNTWKLLAVEDDPREEEVFCCEEPETHSFVLGCGLLTGNCTVSGKIEDSMDSILSMLKESGLTLKAGCGIGYEWSTLRAKDSHVSGAGASTSGPLSFMDVYDKMCGTIASAGGRRGAQMGTFDVSHPDVVEFISAKREEGRLRKFNLSLLITDRFIEAVKNNEVWEFQWEGKPTGKSIPAQELWDLIMRSNYAFAEPGFLLIDRINKYNNLWFMEHIRATNPCGEQPLPPYGACLLGSLNLVNYVISPFTNPSFNWDLYRADIEVFTRLLDNVVEINGLPLAQQRTELLNKRRHGMGYFGLGSALTMMKMKYGSRESIEFTEKVSKNLALGSFLAGADLAKEKGEAPALKAMYSRESLKEHLKYNSNFAYVGKKAHKGRDLFLLSHYFDVWHDDTEGRHVLRQLVKHGSRFTHATSLAPTGTIALSVGNNASNGIEPSFSHFYTRNVIREGRNAKEAIDVYSYEYLAYKTLIDTQATPVVGDLTYENPHRLPTYFSSADTVTPEQHVDIQAAAQKWVDSSISKTINVPTDTPFDKFKDIYLYAHEKGLKGCTTFRFNPEAFQGVLVRPEDLKSTMYKFHLADGSVVEVAGDQEVEYEGEVHSAANLADAIREGYYGKL